jgi:hypothetical protein
VNGRPPSAGSGFERTTGSCQKNRATKRHREAAYGRLLLWLALLEELEGFEGPVLIIDEAENLYCEGVARAERRSTLRSLAFYWGGVIRRPNRTFPCRR